jgi:hypothetical protein
MPGTGFGLTVIQWNFLMFVAGSGADLADVKAHDRFRLGEFRQHRAAAFAGFELGKTVGVARRTFDRFWFRRLTSAAIGIAGPTHDHSCLLTNVYDR